MHTLNIPQWVTDRIVAKNGRAHVHDNLNPAKTALVVVDMQNAFMLPGVAHALCPRAVEIVPNINRLAGAVRETGGTVVWIVTNFTEQTLNDWSTYYDMIGPERTAKRRAALTEGGKGHELWRELDVCPGDLKVSKLRYSAFLPGASDLPDILRQRGIDTVLITGTVTNVCCESSARDAMQLNFKTVMVTDGNAAMTDEEHNWSLINFYNAMGDIMPTDMLMSCLRRNAQKALAAAE